MWGVALIQEVVSHVADAFVGVGADRCRTLAQIFYDAR